MREGERGKREARERERRSETVILLLTHTRSELRLERTSAVLRYSPPTQAIEATKVNHSACSMYEGHNSAPPPFSLQVLCAFDGTYTRTCVGVNHPVRVTAGTVRVHAWLEAVCACVCACDVCMCVCVCVCGIL